MGAVMGDRASKDALYDGFAMVAKALANGRRAEIVDVLSQGERSVEELAAEIGQSVANTSQHLRYLAGAGLVRTRRDGNRVIYALTGPRTCRRWSPTAAARTASTPTTRCGNCAAAASPPAAWKTATRSGPRPACPPPPARQQAHTRTTRSPA